MPTILNKASSIFSNKAKDAKAKKEGVENEQVEVVTKEVAYEGESNDLLSKLKFLIKLLSKFKPSDDLIEMRVSLPSQILDPISFLEYMRCMDRPDLFLKLNDEVDPILRMLSVFKYSITKDRFVTLGPVYKPYNPVLGETIKAYWESEYENQKVKIYQFSEQISHHPPVSAFYYYNEEADIVCRGLDNISGKFTGTAMKLLTSDSCTSYHLKLNKFQEQYFIGRWEGAITGILKFNLSVRPQSQCEITCLQSKLKLVYKYLPEPMFGAERFGIEGKLFRIDQDEPIEQLRQARSEFDLASVQEPLVTISGSWKDKMVFTFQNGETSEFDATGLDPIARFTKPIEEMDATESQRVWKDVSENIKIGEYSKATQAKVKIEEEQRRLRKLPDFQFQPKLFDFDEDKLPILKQYVKF